MINKDKRLRMVYHSGQYHRGNTNTTRVYLDFGSYYFIVEKTREQTASNRRRRRSQQQTLRDEITSEDDGDGRDDV